MANQRKAGIERLTLTITKELLRATEEEAERQGIDRLALLRNALTSYLSFPDADAQEASKPAKAKKPKAARKKAK